MRARRTVLASLTPPASAHCGLWLSRSLRDAGRRNDQEKLATQGAIEALVSEVEGQPLPEGYPEAFDRWRSSFDPDRVALAEARVIGRVLVGSGAKNAAEFGITLHHTWGVPLLPGSALKGVASRGADRHLDGLGWRRRPNSATARDEGPNLFDALFGDVEEQGAVVFHDAWLVPGSDGKSPLHRDVMTVHHPKYYRGEADVSDTDDPNPVPFVSASGTYLLAVEPLDERWAEAAWTALAQGLERDGIGAKTNAGYGRLKVPTWAETTICKRQIAARDAATAAAAKAERERYEAAEHEAQAAATAAREASAARVAGLTPLERAREQRPPSLRHWLRTGSGIDGFPGTQEQVAAAVRVLVEAGDRRLQALHAWDGWVRDAFARFRPRIALTYETLDGLIERHTRRGKLDANAVADAILTLGVDAAGFDLAIEALRSRDAPEGTLKKLARARALLSASEPSQ